MVKGDGAPIARAVGSFGDIIFDQQPGHGGVVLLRQAHQRHAGKGGFGGGVGGGAHGFAVGIFAIASLAATDIVGAIDHKAEPGHALQRT